jgi:excisionase family DNA binding protein
MAKQDEQLFDNSRLMTKREIADYFRVSTRTIDRWSNAGKIRKIKVGGDARFKSEEVAKLLGEKEDT